MTKPPLQRLPRGRNSWPKEWGLLLPCQQLSSLSFLIQMKGEEFIISDFIVNDQFHCYIDYAETLNRPYM